MFNSSNLIHQEPSGRSVHALNICVGHIPIATIFH